MNNWVNVTQNYAAISVFEIALSTLVDIRSTNELTFGGPALILVDRRNMQ